MKTTSSTIIVRDVNFIAYTGAISRINAAFGQGIGPILFDDVRCNGFERRLFDCPHQGLEAHNCGHHSDAGVVCSAGIIRIEILFWLSPFMQYDLL